METNQHQHAAPQTAPSAAPVAETDALLKLTDKAASMVKETIEREGLTGAGLRVAVVGGGLLGIPVQPGSREGRPR